ncbi:MAG: 50S ribosome-binding GTPase [Proteobacteria bacterium]|nr:50S ribosome-binding GTPase [Pseudomonadota bacterium]
MNNYFIIGKVNEGKSHLFNLFSKDHRTISNPKENTTVDIIRKEISTNNFYYYLYDTPGFYNISEFKEIYDRIKNLKISNINFIYLSENFTDQDLKICKYINSLNLKIYYFNFKSLNFINFIPNLFSKTFANQKDNFLDLYNFLSDKNLITDETFQKKEISTIVIFGKENTGKSTLFNKITNIQLSKTSPQLHTTRDSVNWDIQYQKETLRFIDTAGFIRSRSNRKNNDFEKFSINQSEYFIKNASLIVLLLDSTSESKLDLSLIGSLSKRNKPFLVLVNKMDLIMEKNIYQKKFLDYLSNNHNYYSSLNIHFISAINLSKSKILELIHDHLNNKFFFKTSYLNKMIKSINGELGKIQKNSKEFKIYFITAFTVNQKNYFKISCNFNKKNIKPHIKNFLSKILIRELNLKGINFNLIF